MICSKCRCSTYIIYITRNHELLCERCYLMNLNKKQIETKVKIEFFSKLFDIDPLWASSVAMVESALGTAQKSPTGCLGVFQMSTIAMKDLLLSMEMIDDDLVDIVCGIAFLKLLLKRWGNIEKATEKFCNPKDRYFYFTKVKKYMELFGKD